MKFQHFPHDSAYGMHFGQYHIWNKVCSCDLDHGSVFGERLGILHDALGEHLEALNCFEAAIRYFQSTVTLG